MYWWRKWYNGDYENLDCRSNNLVICGMVLLAIIAAGCGKVSTHDPVDAIIAGDARQAASGFEYPLRHNELNPLIAINNEEDFVRLFPVMFDEGVRKELKSVRDDRRGWDFSNWQGEMFDCGEFWRREKKEDGSNGKIYCVNIAGEALEKFYRKVYEDDMKCLKREYRKGMARAYAYFAAEDDLFYGRVDVIRSYTGKSSTQYEEKYRVLIFPKGASKSDNPSECYVCIDADRCIESEDGRIRFAIIDIGCDESPWAYLEYLKEGREVRLKPSAPWHSQKF